MYKYAEVVNAMQCIWTRVILLLSIPSAPLLAQVRGLVIKGNYSAAQLQTRARLTSMEGSPILIDASSASTMTISTRNCTKTADILKFDHACANGILHVIDEVVYAVGPVFKHVTTPKQKKRSASTKPAYTQKNLAPAMDRKALGNVGNRSNVKQGRNPFAKTGSQDSLKGLGKVQSSKGSAQCVPVATGSIKRFKVKLNNCTGCDKVVYVYPSLCCRVWTSLLCCGSVIYYWPAVPELI